MSKIDDLRNKFFGMLAATLFGFGFVSIGIGWILEMIARQRLPVGRRTIEIIERDFDGTVCFKCFFISNYVAFVASLLGLIVLLVWAAVSLIPSRRGYRLESRGTKQRNRNGIK